MEMSYTRPRLNPSRSMKMRALSRTLFTLVVLGAVPIVLLFLFQKESAVRFNGIVDTGFENVGPVDASRIVSIDVKQGDSVHAGDILVRFDSARSILEEQVKNLEIREFEHRLHSRMDDLLDTERRCRQSLVTATEKYLALDMQRIRDEAELSSYSDEMQRIDALIGRKLISEKDVLKVRPHALALRDIVRHYPEQLAVLSNSIVVVGHELEEATRLRIAGEKEVAAGLVAVSEAFAKSDEIRRADPGVMRALKDGTVSGIFHRPGDIVTAGDAVLRLQSADDSVYVTGMLPLGMQDAVKVGDRVWVTRLVYATGRTSPSIPAEVVAIDSEVMDLFAPTDNRPSAPVRGRKTRIRVEAKPGEFIPGEGVVISDARLDGIASLFDKDGEEAK